MSGYNEYDGALGFALGIFIGATFGSWFGRDMLRESAAQKGAAEFYLDGNHTKQFRWIVPPPTPPEPEQGAKEGSDE